jgi:hypothetical protein
MIEKLPTPNSIIIGIKVQYISKFSLSFNNLNQILLKIIKYKMANTRVLINKIKLKT